MKPLLPAMKRTKLRKWEAEKMREKDWIPAGVYSEPFDKACPEFIEGLRVTYRRAGMTKKAGLKSIEKKRFSRFSRSSRLSRISTL